MINRREVDGPQDPIGNIAWAGNLKEMSTLANSIEVGRWAYWSLGLKLVFVHLPSRRSKRSPKGKQAEIIAGSAAPLSEDKP
jgi:hypothetical protein